MSDIVLATLNAKYAHASFGLRCLFANLKEFQSQSTIVEGILQDRPVDFVERLLAHNPKVVGLGVYIWNAESSREIVRILKQVAPHIVVVVGGPEVSYEIEAQEIGTLADHVIQREGEVSFYELCKSILNPNPLALHQKSQKVIDGGTPELSEIEFAYAHYSDEDLQNRTVYLEASRGCPYKCAFCLSALDKTVRAFDGDRFLAALQRLYERGLKEFKFVDRTFNLDIKHALSILQFFLDKNDDALFLHFEMVPDRLPDELLQKLAEFKPGKVQLEVGFQTFNPDVAALINRKTKYPIALENIRKLRAETGVHMHADLIAGLPGEDADSFARGFDRLFASNPHEIQLGILKRLRGFPLAAKIDTHGLRFMHESPYEILCTDSMTFAELQRMRRIARFWNLVVNNGRFTKSAAFLSERWEKEGSVFLGFARMSDHIFANTRAVHDIALSRLAEVLFRYLVQELNVPANDAATLVADDYCEEGKRRVPPLLLAESTIEARPVTRRKTRVRMTRQDRHHAG